MEGTLHQAHTPPISHISRAHRTVSYYIEGGVYKIRRYLDTSRSSLELGWAGGRATKCGAACGRHAELAPQSRHQIRQVVSLLSSPPTARMGRSLARRATPWTLRTLYTIIRLALRVALYACRTFPAGLSSSDAPLCNVARGHGLLIRYAFVPDRNAYMI